LMVLGVGMRTSKLKMEPRVIAPAAPTKDIKAEFEDVLLEREVAQLRETGRQAPAQD
jgi:hypothetical protein